MEVGFMAIPRGCQQNLYKWQPQNLYRKIKQYEQCIVNNGDSTSHVHFSVGFSSGLLHPVDPEIKLP